jgi:hypothetical protein
MITKVTGDFDPHEIEGHFAFAAVGGDKKRAKRNKLLADEIAHLERLESRMRRAFRAWDRQRERVSRLEARLEKEFGK